MRSREIERLAAANPDLDDRVAAWRGKHPDGTLRDAVADLELWPKNPGDPDAQRMIWLALRHIGDPAAERQGFPAMRAASVPAVMDAVPGAPAATAGAAEGCTAGTHHATGGTT
jgi:hypothetical protein